MNKPYVLNNHHLYKPTLVVGEICCNGCQVFHKDGALKVFEEYNVAETHRQDVLGLFEKYNPNEGFDIDKLLDVLFYSDDNEDWLLQRQDILSMFIENYLIGKVETVDTLINNENKFIRAVVAEYCNKVHLDKFVNDPTWQVRAVVASRGYKVHLDKLVNDENAYVRVEVARHGHIDHLNKLVNDPKWVVRCVVVSNGNIDHLGILVNDKDKILSEYAKERLSTIQY